ncbi:YihY/virulence factor BrkB family protein [Leucobacter sp. CSA2]|uniref:YihY/virulence factor BrkB family protein n=1 Tax=Leucobacter edaphi TaxID=2796472 RepID=A0A934QF95_9MICO|nr:YihY/virulence factor BrkB family protein [Leucobacter edaphi]MBK0422442.1 YihY/virulence factor BrkB family protein [Leucobacter edaphi]
MSETAGKRHSGTNGLREHEVPVGEAPAGEGGDVSVQTHAPAKPQKLPNRLIGKALKHRIVRAFLRYSENRGSMLADSITYRALFSVFAAVLLGFSLAALWLGGNPDAMQALSNALEKLIPGIGKVIDPTKIDAPKSFSIVGVVSLLGLIGAAISAIASLRSALRVLADEMQDDVLFIWAILRNLLVAIGFGGLLVAAAVLTGVASVAGKVLAEWLGYEAGGTTSVVVRIVSVLLVFVIDAIAIALAFRVLSGVKPPARALWTGAAIGGVGLVVLQELSGLFVRGATTNPLLGSFAALVALLIWFNLSSQVILIASSYIIVATKEAREPVRERHGAATLLQHRRRRAEDRARIAADDLEKAREAEAEEIEKIEAGKA